MKCQSLFSRKYKKNINLSSAEFAQRMVIVKKALSRRPWWKNRRQHSLLPPVNEKAVIS